MKMIFSLFLLFLVLCACATSPFKNANVVSVYDGDTFKVNLPCKQDVFCKDISVRVKGIDTPEMKGKNEQAIKARDFTANFLKQGKLELANCQRDKYFRLLCDVYVNGDNLAQALLSADLAKKYYGGKKDAHN